MSKFVHAFTTQSKLLEDLSQQIAYDLKTAIRHYARATMLVSGGSTPKPLFEVLRRIDLPWEKVSIGLCDERWVPPTHNDSNEGFVKKHLLQERAGKARFVGMYTEGLSLKEAQEHCSQTYRKELYPFDVTLLGMGKDGHIASLFPESRQLDHALDLTNKKFCIAVEPETAPHSRMSLTRTAILSARHLYLHFEGKEKLAVYQEVIKGEDMHTLPVRSVLQQDLTDIKVYFR
ncbi:6-phosphogluconolactonase [Sulfurimonas sp. HSL3-7]|uniref:6-phosphogluconolactonase n=1 Tax=Sulfonitrofixus jiaomeiensis TaxID=3131938 RepID=UPI0031F96AEA